MKPSPAVVVFADIEGTPAGQSIGTAHVHAGEVFAREGIMLVLCSSMTRAQLETVQQALGIAQPFMCESGAAVVIPSDYFPLDVPFDRELIGYRVVEFGRPHDEVVALLRRISARVGVPIRTFSDLSVEQVANECGLSLAQARLAKLREYDEPFRLAVSSADAHRQLWRALHASRLFCAHRACFEHVGGRVDKGTGVRVLTMLFRRAFGAVATVGVATASSSLSVLKRVRHPFVLESEFTDVAQLSPWIPRLRLGSNRDAWMDALLDIAHRVRERRPTKLPAAG